MHTNDVKITLNHVYPIRGNWWKELILDDNVEYMIKHGLKGEEGAYQMWINYQALAKKAYEQRQGLKLCLETSNQEWTDIRKKIAFYLEVTYFDQVEIPVINADEYVGSYGFNEDIDFYVKTKDKEIYVHAFWPYMALNQIERDIFMFKAFPIKLSFIRNEFQDVIAVDVAGNYDWEIMNKRLKRITKSVK
jgi:hypothetical protein